MCPIRRFGSAVGKVDFKLELKQRQITAQDLGIRFKLHKCGESIDQQAV